MPVVSVLMPTYNAEKYLKEAIDSILNQTLTDFEFLIIDDNSKDKTKKIIGKYNDKRIKLIKGPQKGLAAALNCGIKKAQGKYIARMDADDISLPARFEKQVNYLEAHPEITVLGTWQEHFGRWNFIHKAQQTHDECKAELLFNCDLCHSTLMFRKEDFIKNNMLYPEGSPQEDYELWLNICNQVRFANLPEVLCRHRTYEGSITSQKKDILTTYHVKLLQKFLRENLHINLLDADLDLLQRRYNPLAGKTKKEIKNYVRRLNALFEKIEKKNRKLKIFNIKILHKSLKRNYPVFARGYGDIVSSKYLKTKPIRQYNLLGVPVLSVYKKSKITSYKLFKHIPFISIKEQRNKIKYLFLNFIPLFSVCKFEEKMARVDIFAAGSAENMIIPLSQNCKIKFETPLWYKNPIWSAPGNGFLLNCFASFLYRKINFSCRCIGNGKLDFLLRGPDVRKKGKNIPILFDYKDVVINGKRVLSVPASAWHNQPLKFTAIVKDGDFANITMKYRKHIPSITEIISKLKK